MSDDETRAPASRDRREAVRAKAQQVQAKQSRSRVLRRVTAVVAILAVAGAVGVAVTWVFASTASRPTLSPANMQGDGIVVDTIAAAALGANKAEPLNAATATPEPSPEPTATPATAATAAPVEIRVYVDYLSSGAGEFQQANARQLSQWVNESAATLTYHPVALLTAKSNGTKYSLRAANATACVATHAPETFFVFHNELLAKQPEENTDGYSDRELADLAIAAGADRPRIVRACIEGEDFASWVRGATDRALSETLPGTEDTSLTGSAMILVNGEPYVGALDDPQEFAQFVLTLSSDAYYNSPTPTPTSAP